MLHGTLKKMPTLWQEGKPVQYSLKLGGEEVYLNDRLGSPMHLRFTGNIFCIHCGRKIKKTFAQGYCYPCFTTLAETDSCIVRPHLCHHHLGTCRDNGFAESHCFIPHVVYLAVSSGPKVGITRAEQKFVRWADQGASYTLELAQVPNRRVSGEMEFNLSQHMADTTNWRKMLSFDIPQIDLVALKKGLVAHIPKDYEPYVVQGPVYKLTYPVKAFPPKISSYDLDKEPVIQDRLMGIKGQYLIFSQKVINVRKYQGYEIEVSL